LLTFRRFWLGKGDDRALDEFRLHGWKAVSILCYKATAYLEDETQGDLAFLDSLERLKYTARKDVLKTKGGIIYGARTETLAATRCVYRAG
jgi:hypothetical protein